MRVIIVAPDFRWNSGGIVSLHKWCHQLREHGVQAEMAYAKKFNPDWRTPEWNGVTRRHDVFIYPEIVDGNPYKGKAVFRYMLFPKRIGGVANTDKFFIYSKRFLTESSALMRKNFTKEQILFIPFFRTELFNHDNLPEERDIILTYKCTLKGCDHQVLITDTWPPSQEELAVLYKRAKYLVSNDRYTAITLEAQLCGCPTVVLKHEDSNQLDFPNLGSCTRMEDIPMARSTVMDQLKVYQQYVSDVYSDQFDRALRRIKKLDAETEW